MLQRNKTLYNAAVRIMPWSSWRFTALLNTTSNAPNLEADKVAVKDENNTSNKEDLLQKDDGSSASATKVLEVTEEISNVSQVNILNNLEDSQKSKLQGSILSKIENAKTVKDLLYLTKTPGLSPKEITEIMSAMTNKLNTLRSIEKNGNKEKEPKFMEISDLETNNLSKKQKLFKINKNKIVLLDSNHNMVESIVISNLSIPSMIQVLKKLGEVRHRNVPLLKMINNNLKLYSQNLSIKQYADILYSYAILNYFDEVLLKNIATDLLDLVAETKKGSVIGSIVTSIGLLRYKNNELLDVVCEWAINNYKLLRIQDLSAILQCFATFGYNNKQLDTFLKECIYELSEKNILVKEEWLDIVWSLAVLRKLHASHASSVLTNDFKTKISEKNLNISKLLKLLNINAAAKFTLEDYKGPLIETSFDVPNIHIERSKQRQTVVQAISETLKAISNSDSWFNTNVNTGMGFFIDAECCIDSTCKPVPLTYCNEKDSNCIRLAIMLYEYHDYCKGQKDLTGVNLLYQKLLEAKGYKLLSLSYENFSIEDKLVKRTKFLNELIQSLDKDKQSS